MTKDEFIDILNNYGEIEFSYNHHNYKIESYKDECWFYEMFSNDNCTFKTHDELLEHKLDGNKILDICADFDVTYTC